MSELVLDRVTYTYPGAAAPALADVSLRIEPGEFVVLAGGSGSGKSTLLRAAAGLVPHFHGGEFAGRLVAGGLDSRAHGPAELSAVAGSLFQDPETQVVMGTVRAELAFPLENRGWSAAAVARGVEEAALALGVAGLLERSTYELSGGELQRVALGAALAGRPRLLLLDEPTSQLDPVAGDELLGVLRRVNEEWGTAVVLAEHRLERCLAAADRVIALERGAVTIDADPRGFLEQAPPALQTPGARLFAAAGLIPPPVAVKDARAALRARGLAAAGGVRPQPGAATAAPARARRRQPPSAVAFERVWLEIPRGAAVLRGVDLALAPAERVALMGRNGAGKSTLLRLAAGLGEPTRGRIRRGGRVSLLMQHPGDYLVAERVGEELPAAALAEAGLGALADRHPRDLSGGERQRLALAIVLQGEPPAVVCLDEPTRGMDRAHKQVLAAHLRELAGAGERGARGHPRRGVRRRVGRADGPARRRRTGGRRADERRARRGLVLRDADRAHPRRRRAAARRGRGGHPRGAPRRGRAGWRRRARRRRVVHPRGGRAVSWLAASLLVLGLALVAGFAWYERTHPSARVLALVATLAALAALGRIAFAPLPNVKPTTDIVLLTGYALGGAPGFAVGAVAALASNFFFGQGPWTPWQMCAWGGVGVGGALLARACGRELGRTSLAIACAVAGAGYGVVMNLHLWVTFSGDHSLATLGAYFVTSLPFDLAHVIGNVLFCLLFGPALVRALTRYRERFEITWRPAPALAASVLAAVVLLGDAPRPADAATPAAWLRSAQNRDGGFGGDAGQRSTGLYTSWAGLGLAAAGRNPRDVRHGGSDVVAYVRAHPPSRRSDVGDTTRTILLLRAAGLPPRIGKRNLVSELLARRRPSGSFANRVNTTSFAIFALRAARTHDRAVRSAARWIASQANRDGGFNFATKGGGSGIDDTGAALQALVAAGRRGTPTVRRAARFLARRQNPDGGYPLQPGGPSNAQSTAWAVQALVAAGRNPDRQRRNGARSPIAYLRSLASPSGKVRYSRTSAQTPVWVTAQAVAALARKPFPLAAVPRARKAAPPAPAPVAAARIPRTTPSAPKTTPSRRPKAPPPVAEATSPAALGPPTPPDLAPSLQDAARAAGFLAGALVAPIA